MTCQNQGEAMMLAELQAATFNDIVSFYSEEENDI